MLLEIDDWRSVGDLQYRFNKCFPNLHLQVYNSREREKQRQRPQDSHVLLQDVRNSHQAGVLTIKSWFTKAGVEKTLRDQYGINASVVRLQNDQQLSTVGDENLTLEQLSQKARQAELLHLRQPEKAEIPELFS